jgi:pimeloyl-ACP methyl ester carboxylesterase
MKSLSRIFAFGGLLLALSTSGMPAQATSPTNLQVTRVGKGRPMILVSGLMASATVWDGTIASLRDRYDLHVVTLPGSAGAPAIAGESYLASVRDALARYIETNQLDHPVVVGHSIGGSIALALGAARPDLTGPIVSVDGLPYMPVLMDTTMTPERAAPQATMIANAFKALPAGALAAQARAAMTAQVQDTTWIAKSEKWGAASDAPTVGRAIAEILTTDFRPSLAKINAPVLLMMAGAAFPAAQRDVMRARYSAQLNGAPRHELVVIDGAKHYVMLDAPTAFQRALAQFLNDHR